MHAESAIQPMLALERAADAAATPVEKVHALNALATELARTGEAKRAFAYATQARDLANQLGIRQLDAQTRHVLARCHFYLAEFMPALEEMLAAAAGYQECGDRAGAAAALAGVGLCQHRLGAQDEAVASLIRSLESARELNLSSLEANIYNSLGSTLIAANRVDEAARYLAAGIDLAKSSGDKNLLTKLHLNQSLLAKRRGDALATISPGAAKAEYELGLSQVSFALSLARELQNIYDEVHCLGQSGTMLRLLDRNAEAAAVLDRTLSIGRTLNEPHVQAEALMERGTLLVAEDNLVAAKECLIEAVALARQIAASSVLGAACEVLSLAFEKSGDYASALSHYKEFHAVREAELAGSRKHASNAAQLWLDFQNASRQATQYRAKAERLAADRAALAKEAEALTEVSQQDPLTGLLNRRGLDAHGEALIASSDANAVPLTLALIDVDLFKSINDSFSHSIGDVVLRRVASVIRAHCRQNDLPVRYGGDEFLLVLEGADMEAGTRVLQRLKRAIDVYYWPSEAPGLKVTLSIGIATRPKGGTLAETIVLADRALYDAKAKGRDRIATAI